MSSAERTRSIKDALLRMAAESGGGENLADLITDQCFPSLFINGNIGIGTVLHDAARRGDSKVIDAILNRGEFSSSRNFKEALCRKRNASGRTALHEAMMTGDVEGVRLLFSADKVVAHYPDEEECKSPLYLAIEKRNKEMVDILFPSVSSFLYEHIWRQPEQSSTSSAPTGVQPTGSLLKLQLENRKANEILAPDFYKAIKEQNLFNFACTLEPKCNQGELYILDIVNEVSPAGDTLLHAAASLGSQETVEFIAVHCPYLVTERNIKGDTALHVAARTGSLHNMIVILTCYAKHFGNTALHEAVMLRNELGNTALHEAVMINDVEAVSVLLSADKVVAHYLNKEQKSPLYLAVENENKELVDVLLHAPFNNVENRQGNSPLHAAILKKCSGTLMKQLLDKRPDLINRRDQKGGTPLHYAAWIGYLEGVHTLVKASPRSALERNTKGYLPVHVASKRGHVEVVKEIVEQEWLDPLPLLNLKCQNILHIAAKKGKHSVVSYILKEKKLEKLLNERDKNGNTPLHLASKNLFPKVLLLLTQDKRVKVNLKNNQCMFCMDIVMLKRQERKHRSRELQSSAILNFVEAPISARAYRLYKEKFPDLAEPWLKENVNTLMLVAILVATVTFAAGFTMPGGFISSDDTDPKKRGMAIFINLWMFQVFVICDAVAMYSSIIACFILLLSKFGDVRAVMVALGLALVLVGIALLTMSLAFMAGLNLVVDGLCWLAGGVIFMGTLSVSFLLCGSILLAFPLGYRSPILRHISHIFCQISFLFHGSYGRLPKEKKKTREWEQLLQEDEIRRVRIDIPL